MKFRSVAIGFIIADFLTRSDDQNVILSGEDSSDPDPDDDISWYNWTIIGDDGTVREESSEDPSISISGSGGATYKVTLCVTDRYGMDGSTREPYTIGFEDTVNDRPHASHEGTPEKGEIYVPVILDASKSTDDHGIGLYEWVILYHFSESVLVEYETIETKDDTYSIVLRKTGNYSVTLTVYDDGYLSEDEFPLESESVTFNIEIVEEGVSPTPTATPEPTSTPSGNGSVRRDMMLRDMPEKNVDKLKDFRVEVMDFMLPIGILLLAATIAILIAVIVREKEEVYKKKIHKCLMGGIAIVMVIVFWDLLVALGMILLGYTIPTGWFGG